MICVESKVPLFSAILSVLCKEVVICSLWRKSIVQTIGNRLIIVAWGTWRDVSLDIVICLYQLTLIL